MLRNSHPEKFIKKVVLCKVVHPEKIIKKLFDIR